MTRDHDRMPRPRPATWPGQRPLPRRERGGFAVMAAVLIIVIIGVCGFAIDLSRTYNRKIELQSVADAVALAAAAELNGTATGITNAKAAALEAAARNPIYDYNSFLEWTDDALRFSTAPSGKPWITSEEAATQAQQMFFVEVDTARLDARHGHVTMLLLQVITSAVKSVDIASRAVAGRTSINVLPLAVCAMTDTVDPQGATGPNGELIELGFRRGISYNLMRLNPQFNARPANFLINPVAPAGTSGKSVSTALDVIQPFICTGTMSIPQLTNGKITVDHDFPLNGVFRQLNSRFNSYEPPCTAMSAPSDTNVKEFTPAIVTAWMTDTPAPHAATATTATKMVTIADLPASELPFAPTPDMYGPLWIYAKAAKAEKYNKNTPEPTSGYTTFATADWATLYSAAPPTLEASFPSPAPYKSGIVPPVGALRTLADRRLLNIPLLRCPVPAGSPAPAEVVGIGKFYMTVQASGVDLIGEFAGLIRQEQLVGQVELYR